MSGEKKRETPRPEKTPPAREPRDRPERTPRPEPLRRDESFEKSTRIEPDRPWERG